ncbi:riboflavin synthase [Moraxella atlantae]|uniref:Riboflavin synthase n=1 Tax=Faucicola atlantae TaxID=34059 RepID=A0A378QAK4_9GAMM|nr:riboflavin synthase [Moraxella atlantae]OPH34381.1 riboflavin synthase [Moraxella atlantae]STY96247.1 Riboflavin synthase alpha chain [Moraxella atlantae]
MFTGIIQTVGQIARIEQRGGDLRLTIRAAQLDFGDVKLGDSIASNGVCLTVVDYGTDWYAVDVSRETLTKTTLGDWQVGTLVNLEKAMLPTTRFGGHIVAGHVDAVAQIASLNQDARSLLVSIELPNDIAKYAATKGSITVDGISLTSNRVEDNTVWLNIIPHTAEVTNIGRQWRVGQRVNIEVDLLARYLERLLSSDHANVAIKQDIDEAFLAQHGFMR